MADLTIGYTKTALDFVVNKVQDAIKEEEEERWQTVERDLVFITGEFEMMQSFLNTAHGERLKSLVVRTWVQQVCNLSYDMEDSIEFVLHLDFGKRPWWLRLLPYWMKKAPEAPVDEAVAEITQLKARVMDVSKRNMRYNLVTDSGAKPEAFRIADDSHINSNDVPDLLGRYQTRFDDWSLRVICVVSKTVGDLGTLHFIRGLYEDANNGRDFSRCAWVKLTHPFNPHEFIRNLLAQFLRISCKAKGEKILGVEVLTRMEEIQLMDEFVRQVNTHSYLIVLEGVSSREEWDAIKTYLPDRRNGSRIIVWTSHVEIATLCTGVPYRAFVIRQSSPDHPSHVFYRADSEAGSKDVEEEAARAWPDWHKKEAREVFQAVRSTYTRRVAVWGPPSVGKTALIKAVYGSVRGLDSTGYHRGFAQQAWADVPHPFLNADDLAHDILEGLTEDTWKRGDHLVATCQFVLKHRPGSTLVVLDGVRSKEDWDRIDADLTCAMRPGSCVVVITRDESVPAHCVGRSDVDRMVRVNPLGAPAAHILFLEKLVRSGFVSFDEANVLQLVELEEYRSLLSKCGGLPKFIVTIACYLSHIHDTEQRIAEMRFLNDNFIHQLQSKPEFDCLKYVLAWLHSQFDGSPTLFKKCIFYLLLFSRDSNIRRKRLVRRWIAEGYCSGTSIKEEAENLIGKVGDLCLFQAWETVTPVPGAMSKTTCRVNSSFLDYIISRQKEEKTFLPLEISVLEGRCSLPTNRVGQHLAIRSCWGRDKAAYINLDFSHLRSLTTSGEWKLFFISQKMRVLRVLDLEDTHNLEYDDLDKIWKLMPRLKFLSLRGCKPISCLPESLGDLSLLETLDIKGTDIDELPKTITKLQKLQHIRAGKTQCGSSDPDVQAPAAAPTPAASNNAETPTEQPEKQRPRQSRVGKLSACLTKSFGGSVAGYHTGGVGVPRGMGGMKALHTLGVVNVDMPGGKAFLAEVRKNKNKKGAESHPLRNLSLCGLNWSRHLLNCISGLDQLESLSLQAKKLQVPNFILPPNLVKFSLDVAGILHRGVVDALKDHGKLQTLRLHAEKVETDTVRFFTETNDGESAGGSFSEVKILVISCSSNLHVMFSQQGMQKLELLKVHCRNGSPSEISGLDQLGTLRQVWLIGSCDDTLKEALERQIPKEKINLL